MSSKQMVIEIDGITGEVKVETSGYVGTSCSADINAILDGAVRITKRKAKTGRDRNVLQTTKS